MAEAARSCLPHVAAERADVTTSGERVVIRVPLATVALAGIWGVFVAGAAWLAYESGSAIGVALGTCLVVVGIVLVVRAVRSSLVVDDSGITIRNTWTTHHWSWEEVAEVGWDVPGWARYGGLFVISVCPFGNPYTYAASATATRLAEHRRQAAALAPILELHGVANMLDRETAVVHNWSMDRRSRPGLKPTGRPGEDGAGGAARRPGS
jgi:hypothetical protein